MALQSLPACRQTGQAIVSPLALRQVQERFALLNKSNNLMEKASVEELYYYLALSDVPGIGRVLYKRLIDAFASPEAVFSASPSKLKDVEGINDKIIKELKDFRPDDEKINNEIYFGV